MTPPPTARNDSSGCHLGSSRRWAVAGPFRPGAGGPPQIAPSAAPRTAARRRPPPRRPRRAGPAAARTARTIKAPDPRQRARRTIRTRRSRLADRFSAGQPRRRLITTLVVMLLILSAVLVKVGLLQTVEGDALRSAATQQWTRDRPLRAQRGSIFDRDGEELALSVPASTIAVNPMQVEDPEGTAATFAEVLDLSADRRDELAAEMAAGRPRLPLRRPPGRRRARRPDRRVAAGRRVGLPGGPPDAARRRHRPQRHRAHRHRRRRHGRPRGAVRQRARRQAGRADPGGRPRRSLDRRQRAGRHASRCPATTSC